jgi:CRP-like cAMP-binding protein
MDPKIAAKVKSYFGTFPKRSYAKGQILIFADESPEHIFYMTKGKVRKYDLSYRGDEVIVNTFKAPSFFPMSWAINHLMPNKYFYKTEEETELHIVPADVAVKYLKDNPDVAFDLLSRLYYGMEGMLGRMVHLMSGTAKSRLVYELIIECRRFGMKQDDGSYILTSTESDLASRSGLSRETVSREIHKLKEAGLVSVGAAHIVVCNLKALRLLQGDDV